MRRTRLASAAFAVAAASAAIALTAGSALADTTLNLSYPVNGSSYIASTDSTLELGGTLVAAADITTWTITSGTLTLPNSTGSFDELGFVPITATVAFTQVGQITGTINSSTGEITATADVELRLTDLKVAGIDTLVGPFCQTQTPAVFNITSGAGFVVTQGGPVSATYTIPNFTGCGLLGIEDPIINAVIPGSGNTLNLTLGTPTRVS